MSPYRFHSSGNAIASVQSSGTFGPIGTFTIASPVPARATAQEETPLPSKGDDFRMLMQRHKKTLELLSEEFIDFFRNRAEPDSDVFAYLPAFGNVPHETVVLLVGACDGIPLRCPEQDEGGDAVRDAEHDAYSCQLTCHDPSGEITSVTFSRNAVRITSYQDDSIRTTVERLRRTACRHSGERGYPSPPS